MSTWLITGGAGFVGSNFVRLAAGRSAAGLVVLDSLMHKRNLASIADLIDEGRINFVWGDVCDAACLAQLFREYSIDRIVHFASKSHVDPSVLGARDLIRTNVEGTYRMLEAARKAWAGSAQNKLFLHVSTDEAFGPLDPVDAPSTERGGYCPSSPYYASKAASDHFVRAWHWTDGLPAIVTNSSANYGPWQSPEKFVPRITLNAIEGRDLPIYGDGVQTRDWLHVEDHCEALFLILERGRVGESYAISSGDVRTNTAVVLLICRAVDDILLRAPGSSERVIRHVAEGRDHDRRYALDASKLRNELRWQPRLDFEQAIPSVVAWYVENRDWADSRGKRRDNYRRQYELPSTGLAPVGAPRRRIRLGGVRCPS